MRVSRLPEENTNEEVAVLALALEEIFPPVPELLEIVGKPTVALGRLAIVPTDVNDF